jgi:hypothetical protein
MSRHISAPCVKWGSTKAMYNFFISQGESIPFKPWVPSRHPLEGGVDVRGRSQVYIIPQRRRAE